MNLNVEGRRLPAPLQGFGKMWQKTYRVRLQASGRGHRADRHLEAALPGLLAGGQPFYAPLTGIEPGEVALLDCRLPGG